MPLANHAQRAIRERECVHVGRRKVRQVRLQIQKQQCCGIPGKQLRKVESDHADLFCAEFLRTKPKQVVEFRNKKLTRASVGCCRILLDSHKVVETFQYKDM